VHATVSADEYFTHGKLGSVLINNDEITRGLVVITGGLTVTVSLISPDKAGFTLGWCQGWRVERWRGHSGA
jgi:hypothetical protein